MVFLNINRSGTDEDFSQKNQLLTELAELFDERDVVTQKQAADSAAELARARHLRDNACLKLSEKKRHDPPKETTAGDATTPPAKRRTYGSGLAGLQESSDAIVSYLREKSAADMSLERRRLELEEKRLQMEEKKREQKRREWEQKLKEKEDDRQRQRQLQEDDRREKLAMLSILDRLADKLK